VFLPRRDEGGGCCILQRLSDGAFGIDPRKGNIPDSPYTREKKERARQLKLISEKRNAEGDYWRKKPHRHI